MSESKVNKKREKIHSKNQGYKSHITTVHLRNPQQVFILNCLGPQPQLEGDHQQKRTSKKPQNPSSVSITLVKLSRYSFSGLLGLTLSFQV